MRFWDSSAIVPLLVDEPGTSELRRLLKEDHQGIVWWGTPVECASVLARLRREETLDIQGETDALKGLATLLGAWAEVQPSEEVRSRAGRLLRVHPLRGADALQLGAALTWAGTREDPVMVTLDERLGRAARLEGLTVLPGT